MCLFAKFDLWGSALFFGEGCVCHTCVRIGAKGQSILRGSSFQVRHPNALAESAILMPFDPSPHPVLLRYVMYMDRRKEFHPYLHDCALLAMTGQMSHSKLKKLEKVAADRRVQPHLGMRGPESRVRHLRDLGVGWELGGQRHAARRTRDGSCSVGRSLPSLVDL